MTRSNKQRGFIGLVGIRFLTQVAALVGLGVVYAKAKTEAEQPAVVAPQGEPPAEAKQD